MNYDKELSEIYHNLNCWEWDKRIGIEPNGWNDMDYNQKSRYIRPIMRVIEVTVPNKVLYLSRIKKIYSCGNLEAILRMKKLDKYIDLLRNRGLIKLNYRDERAYQLLKNRNPVMTRKRYLHILNADIEK